VDNSLVLFILGYAGAVLGSVYYAGGMDALKIWDSGALNRAKEY
jgi:hypothetical protein